MLKSLAVLFFLVLENADAKVYQLKELIELAKSHPELKIEQFEVQKAETFFERIDGEMRPKITLLSGIGPDKSTTGNALSSSQSSSVDTLSYLAKLDVKVPLFAFNRKGDLEKAATGNLKVKEIDLKKKEASLVKKVKEYFYGLQYASSLNEFATSTLKDLDEVIAEIKDKKGSKTTPEELNKLILFRSLAQVKKYEIEKGMAQAVLGLKYITQEDSPSVEQDWIELNLRELPPLKKLTDNLAETNLDLKKVNLGVEAKSYYLSSEKKSQLPVFGLFSSFDWQKTPKSTKQASYFTYDPYNKSDFSIGLGLIWDIDFGVKSSQVSMAKIELAAVQAQQNFAIKNLPTHIEKVYLDLIEAQNKAVELEKSYKTSKKLLTNIASGVALGITPAKDIIEAYTLKVQIYQQYVEAIYQYEMRLAELSYEVGIELDSSLN